MNEDPSKMYEFLEALNLFGSPPYPGEKERGSRKGDKEVYAVSWQESKQCFDQCDDCSCVFCDK